MSQLDKIARCPYDFYLTYVEEIEPYSPPEIEEMPEFWGTLLHLAAEKAAKEFKGKIMDDTCIQKQFDLFRHYVEKSIEQPSFISEKFSFKLPAIMKSFLNKRKEFVYESFLKILKKHKGHRIIATEEPMIVKIDKMLMRGKFDRIEETESGVFEIIDYKSGKSPDIKNKYPESNCLELGNLELPLYGLIYQRATGRRSKILVWSLNFDQSKKIEADYSYIFNYVDRLEEDLNKIAQLMIEEKFRFDTGGKNCFGCSFSNVCVIKGEDVE